MTERLYLNDSYLKACTAEVTACAQAGGGYDVELSRTVFFPTGGGQPHDTGLLGKVPVVDVTEEGDHIFHRVNTPIAPGTQLTAEIDWPRRFDHMQQHSGEHLLSFAAKELFGALNVGFHMAGDYCTVDFDIPLAPGDIRRLEERTNALITANLPVLLKTVDGAELAGMELRKAAKGLEGDCIRIVYMPGGDSCTCCGTHVNHTGEIGLTKITHTENYKGGCRLTFLSGARALTFVQDVQGIADALANMYSCKVEDVPAAVKKTQDELNAARRETKTLYTRVGAALARDLRAGAENIKGLSFMAALIDYPAAYLRTLANELCAEKNTLALLFARSGEQLGYVLCCSKDLTLDIGELIEAVNTALNGKGGGRGTLAQGSAKYTRDFENTLMQLKEYITRRLMAQR